MACKKCAKARKTIRRVVRRIYKKKAKK